MREAHAHRARVDPGATWRDVEKLCTGSGYSEKGKQGECSIAEEPLPAQRTVHGC